MADLATLRHRLVQVFALDAAEPADKYTLAAAIRDHKIEGAVCAREPALGGRVKNFAAYFELVFGETLDGKQSRGKQQAAP